MSRSGADRADQAAPHDQRCTLSLHGEERRPLSAVILGYRKPGCFRLEYAVRLNHIPFAFRAKLTRQAIFQRIG